MFFIVIHLWFSYMFFVCSLSLRLSLVFFVELIAWYSWDCMNINTLKCFIRIPFHQWNRRIRSWSCPLLGSMSQQRSSLRTSRKHRMVSVRCLHVTRDLSFGSFIRWIGVVFLVLSMGAVDDVDQIFDNGEGASTHIACWDVASSSCCCWIVLLFLWRCCFQEWPFLDESMKRTSIRISRTYLTLFQVIFLTGNGSPTKSQI